MTKQKGPDKNLQNVADRLDLEGVNAFHANQLNQDINDRKHEAWIQHDTTTNKGGDQKGMRRE
ncbi:hypothetical protein ACFQWB_14510 [Paenibacillus thermoaerophilus]|uniref:Uncharacterized protein n=1 Tax=Paenibacillus thermoaerophilus TaxID=1215385 RepID=A0ABW2V8M7_9BACL|nr:hypothetical protein [Paenibacillus thermoaerophilus]TMV12460.1 hypothetical protein FE781_11895 [Paenibacillus thermoaerophilus]